VRRSSGITASRNGTTAPTGDPSSDGRILHPLRKPLLYGSGDEAQDAVARLFKPSQPQHFRSRNSPRAPTDECAFYFTGSDEIV